MLPFHRSLAVILFALGLLSPAIADDAKTAPAPAGSAQSSQGETPAPAETARPWGEVECVLDMAQQGIPLPKIFIPGIDLSGRGFHADVTWPQTVAAPAVIDCWGKDIGFRGMYRLQFNLWEISELAKNKELQRKLLANYESVIKRVSDAGGIVILDVYSIPQGQGKVLDKTSSPVDPDAFKQQVKEYIRYFSCVKRYNIWYEVWSAPDLDDFFLGRKNEYLQMYRCVAEAVKELQAETRDVIPVGGPSTSWWFRGFDESTILTPERSLIYDLIKFCYHNKLPLDFISWHAYATDPKTESGLTAYNRGAPELIRDWLSYFGFPKETPLIVDEWNFDTGRSNVLEERQGRGNVCASYLISRLKGMYEAGLDYQVFFSLEDFQENREGVVRNSGIFWYQPSQFSYTGGSKNIYNAFRMLASLEPNLLSQPKASDEFAGVIATRGRTDFAVIVYNYADPDAFRSLVSRSIGLLNEEEREGVLSVVRTKAANPAQGSAGTPRLSGKAKNLLKKARELSAASENYAVSDRQFRLTIRNMNKPYILRRYSLDDSCVRDCSFLPAEEKEVAPGADRTCQQLLTLKPYSVALIVIKPAPPPSPVVQAEEEKAVPTAPGTKEGSPVKAEAPKGPAAAAQTAPSSQPEAAGHADKAAPPALAVREAVEANATNSTQGGKR